MSLRENLLKEYGLEKRDVSEDGKPMDGKSVLQICLTNARLVAKDGTPAILPNYPQLCIGSLGAAYNLDGLQTAGITHVLCVSGIVRIKYPEHFVYHRLDIQDKMDVDLSVHWEAAWSFIDDALTKDTHNAAIRVLIHCYQGISRSTTILCSYLMKRYKLTMMQALNEIRSVRPQIAPNPGFLLQLRALDRQLNSEQDN